MQSLVNDRHQNQCGDEHEREAAKHDRIFPEPRFIVERPAKRGGKKRDGVEVEDYLDPIDGDRLDVEDDTRQPEERGGHGVHQIGNVLAHRRQLREQDRYHIPEHEHQNQQDGHLNQVNIRRHPTKKVDGEQHDYQHELHDHDSAGVDG